MNNEKEQKKEYVAPQMELIDMDYKTSLLAGSAESQCTGFCGELD